MSAGVVKPNIVSNGLGTSLGKGGFDEVDYAHSVPEMANLTCCCINFARLRSCRFCSSRLAPSAICSAALRWIQRRAVQHFGNSRLK
jgi:hypothetical protein